MSRLFVVDTENTNDYSFINKYLVSEEDEIVLFISDRMKAVKSDGCIDLLTSKGKILIEKIENGQKNALDFQLVVYITERAIRGDYEKIYIVSKDHGYRSVVKYIHNKFDKTIIILSGKQDEIKPENEKESNSNSNKIVHDNSSKDKCKSDASEKIKQAIIKVVPNATDEQIEKIIDLKTNEVELSEVHNELLRLFKDDGKEIYKYVKPIMEKN